MSTTNTGAAVQFSVALTRPMLYRVAMRDILPPSWRIMLAYACCVIVLSLEFYEGTFDSSWVALGLIVFLTIRQVMAWWRARRGVDDWLRMQGNQPVVYELTDFGLKVTSAMGSVEGKWELFDRLTVDHQWTRLHDVQRGETTLPTDQVPPAALEMLIEQFTAHGKPVVDNRATTSTRN